METTTIEAPPRRKVSDIKCCGFCGGAPVTVEPEASHLRCPGSETCMCAADDHKPTPRVLQYQAAYSFADPRLVVDVAETWTWDATLAMENALGVTKNQQKRAARRERAEQKADKAQPPSSRPAGSSSPSSNARVQSGANRTLSPIEQLAELVPAAPPDPPGNRPARPTKGAAKL